MRRRVRPIPRWWLAPTVIGRRSALRHHGSDLLANHRRVVVFPGPHDEPPDRDKASVSVFVAGLVTGDLVRPVPAVDVMSALAVLWAAVPEAPVDEDRNPGRTERDVDAPAASARDHRPVEAVTEAATMKLAPESQLRRGIALTLELHPAANAGGSGPGATYASTRESHVSNDVRRSSAMKPRRWWDASTRTGRPCLFSLGGVGGGSAFLA